MSWWSSLGESAWSGVSSAGSALGSQASTSLLQGANNWLRYADSNWFGGMFGIEKSHQQAAENDFMYSAMNALNYARYFNPEIQRLNLKSYKDALKSNGYNPIMAITNGQVQGGNVTPHDSRTSARGDPTAMATVANLIKQNDNLDAQNDVLHADGKLKTAQAEATKENAETAKWEIKDARSLGAAGFEILKFGASGKKEVIQTIRINKVTGEVYDALTGRKVDLVGTIDNSAKSKPAAVSKSGDTYNYYHFSQGELPKDQQNKGNYRDWRSIND